MSIDISTIGIDLRTDGLERGQRYLSETERAANRAADAATRAGSRASSGFREYGSAAAIAERQTRALADTTATFGRLMGTVFAGLGASALIGQIDAYTKFTAQLKLASTGSAEFAGSLENVRRIATTAQADLASMGTLYARIANSTREMGIGQKQVAAITETVGLSLKVSGASAGEAASAMLQLSQAFGSGRLNGQEFAAIAEAAPGLLQILADSLGVSRGALKAMSEEGKLTTEVMVRAFGNPAVIAGLREQSKEVETIGGAFVVLKNNVMEFVGVQAHASGAVSALTGGIGALANNLDLITAAALGLATAKIGQVIGDIGVRAATAATGAAAYTQAQIAQRNAAIAAAQAELATANAIAARLTVTQAALVLARQEAMAALQRANASATAAQSQIAAARAAGAQSFALASLRQGEVALAAAITARSAATAELAILGAQAARMTAQQTAATVAQTAAQNTLTAAQRTGSLAAGLASTAMAALGGPVAIITTLLGLGVTAWMLWGRAAKDGSAQAEQTVLEKSKSIRETLRAEIALIDKRNAALNYKPSLQGDDAQLETIGGIEQKIDALRAKAVKNQTEEVARQRDINALLSERGLLEQDMAEKAAKAATQQARKDAAGQPEALLEARRKLLGVGKEYEAQLKTLSGLHASGAMGLEEYRDHVNKLATDTYKSSVAGKAAAEATKSGASAAKSAESAYASLISSINQKIEAERLEAATGKDATESQKLRIKLDQDLAAGRVKLGAAEESRVRAALDTLATDEKMRASADALRKSQADLTSARDKEAMASAGDIAKIHEKAQALEDEAAAYGKTAVELQALTIARLEMNEADIAGFAGSEKRLQELDDMIAALERVGAATDALAARKLSGTNDETLRNAKELARLYQGEVSTAGLTATQRKLVSEQRKIELDYAKKLAAVEKSAGDEAEKAQERAKLNQAKQIEMGLAAAQAQDEAWGAMWESVDQTAHDVFVNVADEGMDAFKRIGKTLKSAVLDMLYQMTIKKWIFSIAGSMGGGVGGLMNSASNAYSLYGAASGYSGGVNNMAGLMGAGSAAGASAVSLGYANAVGAVGGDALGALIAGNASWAGVAAGSAATAAQAAVAAGLAAEAGTAVALAAGTQAAAAGTVVAGGTAATGGLSAITGAMAAIPVWGWALAAAAGLGAMLSKKQTLHSGAGAVYSAEGGLQEGAGIYNQSTFGMGDVREYNKAEQLMASGIATGLGATLDGLAVAFGQTAGYEIATAFADDSSKDGAWGSLRISKDGKDLMNWEDTRKSKWAPKEFSDGEAGQKEYLAAIAKDTRQVLLDMDLPSWADTLLTSIGEVASMEQLSQAVMQIGQIQTAFVQLGKTVDGFAGMGDKAFEALLQASGGIEALTTNVGAYYEAYYTEAERMGKATEQLTAELAKAGVAMPASKDAYRALVTQQLEAGEGGAALAAQLLGLSGAFVQVADYAAAVAEEWAAVQLKFLSPAERDQAQYDSIAASLRGSGMGLSIADFAGQLKNATLASIGAIAQEVWPTLQTDEARLALIRATSALADLKGGADALGKGQFEAVDSAFAALQKSVGLQRSVVQEAISSMRAVFDALRDNARELYGEVESASLQSADAGRAFIDNALANAQATGYMPDADDLRDAIDGVRKGIAQQQYASTFESDRDRLVLAGKLTDLKDIAGPQLTEAQRQLAALEEMLETARTQIDELRGINTSMLSVSAAMTLLAAAISAEKVMQPQLAAPKPPAVLASGGPSNSGYSQSEMAGAINITLGQGASVADIINAAAVNYGITEREVREAAKFAGIPGFASGGLHSGGLRVVGERGWEVEATGPSRIWNQQQLGAALCGGGNTARLEALVEGLTAEVQRLQGIVARGVEHQRETAEILDNVTEGGNAMRQGAMV